MLAEAYQRVADFRGENGFRPTPKELREWRKAARLATMSRWSSRLETLGAVLVSSIPTHQPAANPSEITVRRSFHTSIRKWGGELGYRLGRNACSEKERFVVVYKIPVPVVSSGGTPTKQSPSHPLPRSSPWKLLHPRCRCAPPQVDADEPRMQGERRTFCASKQNLLTTEKS